MGKSQWGPPIWNFFHTLAENVKEDHFQTIGPQLISQIIQICHNLPCPECTQHAKLFWSRTKLGTIKTKTDLKNVLFVFHNSVNQRTNKPQFKYDDLDIYKTRHVLRAFNFFYVNFNTNGNMTLLTESFHRRRLLTSLKKWLSINIIHFDLHN